MPEISNVAPPPVAKEIAVLNVSSAPPAPTIFKTIGYVEKANGQLEAVILQDNEVQVVHIGERIAGRYRVTKIAPDSVDAIDETLVQSPMAKPGDAKSNELTARATQPPSTLPMGAVPARPEVLMAVSGGDRTSNVQGVEPVSLASGAIAPAQATPPSNPAREDWIAPPQGAEAVADSLGYVEKANGKVEAVVADGDSVRLVSATPTVTVAQVMHSGNSQMSVAPSHELAPSATAASSTRAAMAERSVHSDGASGLSPASFVRQASMQTWIPASGADDGSAPVRLNTRSGTAAGTSTLTASVAGRSDSLAEFPVEMKPLGFVVRANGELAAILTQDDEMYIVRQGERFADRYRAVNVSADAVQAVEEPRRQALQSPFVAPPVFPDSLSAVAQLGSPPVLDRDCLGCDSSELGEVSAKAPDDPLIEAESPPPRIQKDEHVHSRSARELRRRPTFALKKSAPLPEPATFVFQTLGYVETHDGDMRAIVAVGSQVYLVKQGDTFANQYRATSVDPILVLAVRAPAGQYTGNFLSAQTESDGKSASKKLYGYLHFPSSRLARAQAPHEVDASGSPVLMNFGVNLLNLSPTGFDMQSNFFMADNPKVGF